MRRSNFAMRLPPTLLAEARKAAGPASMALNQLIALALAEMLGSGHAALLPVTLTPCFTSGAKA